MTRASPVAAQMALQVALVVQELATNPRKYGALSTPDGKLTVTWSVVSDGARTLRMSWVEKSGKKQKLPAESKRLRHHLDPSCDRKRS